MRRFRNFLVLSSGAVAAAAMGCQSHLIRSPETKQILVIGHRGASGSRPEHTRASYELAVSLGADFIECDLVMTKDGRLIIRHENEMSETTDVAARFPARRTRKVVDGKKIEGWFSEDFTWAEIRTLRAKERLRTRDHGFDGQLSVLAFDEYLELAQTLARERGRPVGVYIEIKHPTYFAGLGLPLEAAVSRAVRNVDTKMNPIYFQSFELSRLRKLSSRPGILKIFLMDDRNERPADFVQSGDPRTYGDLTSAAALREIKREADGIGPFKRLIVPESASGPLGPATSLVREAHAAGLVVHPYTFRSDPEFLHSSYGGDPVREYEQFFGLGVDGVFTDFPADAVRARAKFEREGRGR